MRTVLIAAGVVIGVLVLLVAVVAVIGMTLPRDHVATRTVRVRQTPEQVFAIISDVEKVPAWRAEVTRVEILPSDNGRMMFREHGSDAVTYRVEVSEPPRRRVVRIADTNLPYGGAWTYDLTPVAPAASTAPITQVTITERGEVYNPIFRVLSRFVFGHTATMEQFLRNLERKLR